METPDQIMGLHQLAKLVGRRECDCVIIAEPGDVPVLRAVHRLSGFMGPTEVVCATGAYDFWVDGDLMATNLSVEVAAEAVMAEYRSLKNDFITSRSRNGG